MDDLSRRSLKQLKAIHALPENKKTTTATDSNQTKSVTLLAVNTTLRIPQITVQAAALYAFKFSAIIIAKCPARTATASDRHCANWRFVSTS